MSSEARHSTTRPVAGDSEVAVLEEIQSAAKASRPVARVAAFLVDETDVVPPATAWLTLLTETDTVAQVHSGVGVQQFRRVDGRWFVRSYCAIAGRPRTRVLTEEEVEGKLHPPATLRTADAWDDDLEALHESHAVESGGGVDG